MELKKCKLGDLIELQRGYDLPASKMQNGNIPVAGSNGIIGYHNISKINPPCITIGRSGSVGKIHYYDTPIWPHNTSLYIKDYRGNDATYIYYLLKTIDLVRLCDSSVVPSLNRNFVYPIEIKVYTDICQQKRIAAVLSTLDRKIALNRSINEELERMAKEIYDHWFVQFDFPNADGRPYKSSGGKMVYNPVLKREIPEGWEVVTLESVLGKIASGRRPGPIDKSLKRGIPSLGAECVNELGVFNYEKTPFVASKFQSMMTSGKIEDKDILIYKDGAYVGKTTLFQDNFPYTEAYVNEHVFLVSTKDKFLQYYLYFTLNQTTYFDIMQSLGKAKAAQPGLNQQDLKNIIIILPDKEIYTMFYKKIENHLHLLFCNSSQSENLRKLRDELLPLLMTGQVGV